MKYTVKASGPEGHSQRTCTRQELEDEIHEMLDIENQAEHISNQGYGGFGGYNVAIGGAHVDTEFVGRGTEKVMQTLDTKEQQEADLGGEDAEVQVTILPQIAGG